MSRYLSQEMLSRGQARVIVVLRAATGTGAAASKREGRRLGQRFRKSGSSLALATSLGEQGEAYRIFPQLGIMLGTVDHDGLAALRADPEVVSVVGAPALSPIRPRAVRAARSYRASSSRENSTVPSFRTRLRI